MYAPDDIWDRLYYWIFNVGKYILVMVEFLVLVVFASRFMIDRRNNDLSEEINNRIDTLGNDFFKNAEIRYSNLHLLLEDLASNNESQPLNSKQVSSVLDGLPSNIKLQNFNFGENQVSMNFTAPSFESIRDYEQKIQSNPAYSDISVRISKSGEVSDDIDFSVSFKINSESFDQLGS